MVWFCFVLGRGDFSVVSGKEFFFFWCVAEEGFEEGFCECSKFIRFWVREDFLFCVCVCVFEVVKNWIIFGKRSE